MGREAAELAASAGLVFDGWEAEALEDGLVSGRMAVGRRSKSVWIVPRQNGKGAVLEARELAGLFLFGERLILHSAHQFKTAQEAFRRILFLVQSSPDLERLVVGAFLTRRGGYRVEIGSAAPVRGPVDGVGVWFHWRHSDFG